MYLGVLSNAYHCETLGRAALGFCSGGKHEKVFFAPSVECLLAASLCNAALSQCKLDSCSFPDVIIQCHSVLAYPGSGATALVSW